MRAKILFATLMLLLGADAVMWHGRYREQVVHRAVAVEEAVLEQNWSTPLVG